MKTDRELLESAAKAAGLWDAENNCIDIPWNPLTDDGDALRLAVKLRILVDPDGETYAVATAVPKGRGEVMISEKHRDDPCAATRRAIVRAAAQIGEMP
jgi:hypothetical protein